MIMDNYMDRKLTDDAKAAQMYESLSSGYTTPEDRRLMLLYIKFNRLERKAEPQAPVLKQEPPCGDYRLACPGCGKPIENVWSSRVYQPHFCHYCGQALDWRHPDDND
jgi:hypothetical protein